MSVPMTRSLSKALSAVFALSVAWFACAPAWAVPAGVTPSKTIRTPIAVLFIGQSVTHGNVPQTQVTASFAGNQMTVSVVGSGVVEAASANLAGVGATVLAAGVPAGVTVSSQNSGTVGSTGVYTLSASVGTIASEPAVVQVKQAFQSLNTNLSSPLFGAVSSTGGSLFRLIDDLWSYGYSAQIVNGAKGSMSLVSQGAGQIGYRFSSSSSFYARRAAVGGGDRGFAGSRISPAAPGTGPVWVETTGRNIAAMGALPNTILNTAGTPFGSNLLDYIQYGNETNATGGCDFQGNISGTGVTVTSDITTPCVISAGQYLYGYGSNVNGVLASTQITAVTSGSGGVGTTFTISKSGQDGTGKFLQTAPDFYDGAVGSTVTDGTVVWTMESTTNSYYGGGPNTVLTNAQPAHGFDPFSVLQAGLDQLNALQSVTNRYAYIDGNQSDLSVTQATRQAAVTSAATFFLTNGVNVIIGNMIYSPGSGTMAQAQTQNAANLAAYNALKTGPYGAMVFFGADLYTALGTNLVAQGCLQADQIHLNGACSMLQGDAYATAIETILGKPGFQ